MLFKDFILNNADTLKSQMFWENYDLNDVELPVVTIIKEHSLDLLAKYYGKFEVENDILDEVESEIFINFPILLQQLSISRIMTSENVPKTDTLTETMDRTESGTRNITSDIVDSMNTTQRQTSDINQTRQENGNISEQVTAENDQNMTNTITNTSSVDETGSRGVSLSHSMPEQAFNNTGNFPKDTQGTPIIDTAYTQGAAQSFSTINPLSTQETSRQTQDITQDNSSLRTNENSNTIKDTGSNTNTTTNTGSNTSESEGVESTDNTIHEVHTREVTNPQYAYEISNFLKEIDSVNAFKRFLNAFSWVCGIA